MELSNKEVEFNYVTDYKAKNKLKFNYRRLGNSHTKNNLRENLHSVCFCSYVNPQS